MIEEADAGLNRRLTGAVDGHGDRDVGFLGFALDLAFAHGLVRPCLEYFRPLEAGSRPCQWLSSRSRDPGESV